MTKHFFSFLIAISFLLSSCSTGGYLKKSTAKFYNKNASKEVMLNTEDGFIHAYVAGQGRDTLVLLHGFGPLPALQWKYVLKEFGDEFTLIIPEMIYFGKSSSHCGEFSPDFERDQMFKLLDNLGVKKYHLTGLSYGGLIASMMAEARPDQVLSLHLIDALNKYYTAQYADSLGKAYGYDGILDMIVPADAEAVRALMEVSTHKQSKLPKGISRDILIQFYDEMRWEKREVIKYLLDHDTEIAKMQINYSGPTYIYWGESDHLIPIETGQRLFREDYKKAVFVKIPKSGHVPPLEKKKIFHAAFRDALNEVTSKAVVN